MKTKDFLPSLLLERDGDDWVAHVLDLDVYAEGATLNEAMHQAIEVAALTIIDDLNEGLDPARRTKRTPAADWARFERTLSEGKRADSLDQVSEDDAAVVVMRLWMSFQQQTQPEPAEQLAEVIPLRPLPQHIPMDGTIHRDVAVC